jgi:hypothetical protein
VSAAAMLISGLPAKRRARNDVLLLRDDAARWV